MYVINIEHIVHVGLCQPEIANIKNVEKHILADRKHLHMTPHPSCWSFKKVVAFKMHLDVLFCLKKIIHILLDKQQWKCPQDSGKDPREAKICSLLGTIWCELLSFVLWAWYFLLVTWSCRAPDFGLCTFWSRVPRSGRGCCPAVLLLLLSAEGRLKCKYPHS